MQQKLIKSSELRFYTENDLERTWKKLYQERI